MSPTTTEEPMVAQSSLFSTALISALAAPSYTAVPLSNSSDNYTHSVDGSFHIQGLNGNDTITVAAASTGSDYLDGGAGNDVLNAAATDDFLDGGAGTDRLNGGDGNDVLRGGAGADILTGGTGVDTADYATSVAAVTISLPTDPNRTARGFGGDASMDTLGGIENVTGSAWEDRLTGNRLDNQLVGNDGEDFLRGMDGNDVLIGDAMADANMDGIADDEDLDGVPDGVNEAETGFNDFLDGGFGDDRLFGGGGNDTLNAGFGNDALYGGHGDDLLNASDGDDLLDGGEGNDDLIGSLGDDILRGGGGNDFLNASIGTDVLEGGAGDDELHAGDGDDTLDGGDGDDELFGGGNTLATDTTPAGGDIMAGGAGNDLLDGADGNDVMDGGEGDDTLRGGNGADQMDGGAGVDTLDYSTGGAVGIDLGSGAVSGAATGDTFVNVENVTGSSQNDIIVGDGNANTLTGGAGADQLFGQSGFDTADYSGSAAGVTISINTTVADPSALGTGLGGDADGDTLQSIERVIGSALADVLTGGEFSDTFMGGGGADMIDGGLGTDTAEYSSSAAGVTIALDGAGAATGVGGDAEGDQLAAIENLIGSDHDDVLYGNAGVNRLEGGGGNDMFRTGAGGTPSGPFEFVIGGDGIDTIDYSNSGAVFARLFSGTSGPLPVSQGGEAHGDILLEMENAIGSNFNDRLDGTELANMLDGGAGNDQLFGFAGDDVLIGGTGLDRLDGGDGDDLFKSGTGGALPSTANPSGSPEFVIGGNGVDTIDYSDSLGAVFARLFNSATSGGFSQGGDAHGDILLLIENIIGSNGNDLLHGSEISNRLEGGAGEDTLVGFAGADELFGGSGGADTADYSASDAAVIVQLHATLSTLAQGGHAQGDVLNGIESVIGSNGSDTLRGSTVANKLVSGAGNDQMRGGSGGDILSATGAGQKLIWGDGISDGGAAGLDVFRILGGFNNIIADYQAGEDLHIRASAATLVINALFNIPIEGVTHRAARFTSTEPGSESVTFVSLGTAATTSSSQAIANLNNLIANDLFLDPGLIA